MAWSTREIAELAGTTLNTVRHYHRVGLLEEPERMSNGYKQYEVRHLVRLLQIRRLRDLGVPIDRIEQAGATGSASAAALSAIDADLERSIERLQRARAEIGAILRGSTTTDVPAGFEDVAERLSGAERPLMLIYSQLYDDEAMADTRRMLEAHASATGEELESLPAEADEDTRRDLAERYALLIERDLAEYPWLSDPTPHLKMHPRIAEEAIVASVAELYNPAQLDVLARAAAIANARRKNDVASE